MFDVHYLLDLLEAEYETDSPDYTFKDLKSYVLELEKENKNLKEIIDIQRHNLSILRKRK